MPPKRKLEIDLTPGGHNLVPMYQYRIMQWSPDLHGHWAGEFSGWCITVQECYQEAMTILPKLDTPVKTKWTSPTTLGRVE